MGLGLSGVAMDVPAQKERQGRVAAGKIKKEENTLELRSMKQEIKFRCAYPDSKGQPVIANGLVTIWRLEVRSFWKTFLYCL